MLTFSPLRPLEGHDDRQDARRILTLLAAERGERLGGAETLLARAGLSEDEVAAVLDPARGQTFVKPAWEGFGDRPRPRARYGRTSVSATRKRSSAVSTRRPSMCSWAGPSSVQRSRKNAQPSISGSSERVIASTP